MSRLKLRWIDSSKLSMKGYTYNKNETNDKYTVSLSHLKDRAVRKARRLLESRDVDEDLARVLRVMEYNVTDLPEIAPPPVNKDKRPIIKLTHKKRKL